MASKKTKHNSLPIGYSHRDQFYDFYYDDNYEDFMQYDFSARQSDAVSSSNLLEEGYGYGQEMEMDFPYDYAVVEEAPKLRTRSRSMGNTPSENLWDSGKSASGNSGGNGDFAYTQPVNSSGNTLGGSKRSSFLIPIEENSPAMYHQQHDQFQQQRYSQSYNPYEPPKISESSNGVQNRFRHSHDEIDYSHQNQKYHSNRLRHSHDGFQSTGHAFRNRDVPPEQLYGNQGYSEQPPMTYPSHNTPHLPSPTPVYQTPKQEYHSPPQSHMYHKFDYDDDVEMGDNNTGNHGHQSQALGTHREYDNYELSSASNNHHTSNNSASIPVKNEYQNQNEEGLFLLEGVPQGFKLNASKSPIMECIVFAALMKWGIEIIVHELQPLNIVFRISKFDYFYFASDAVCAKPNPGSEESRLRAIKRYFNNFPLKKQRNNSSVFDIEVKSQFVEKVDNVISFVRNMYFS